MNDDPLRFLLGGDQRLPEVDVHDSYVDLAEDEVVTVTPDASLPGASRSRDRRLVQL